MISSSMCEDLGVNDDRPLGIGSEWYENEEEKPMARPEVYIEYTYEIKKRFKVSLPKRIDDWDEIDKHAVNVANQTVQIYDDDLECVDTHEYTEEAEGKDDDA